MIHYHGGPITPANVARQLWTRRHAFVSFENPEQLDLAAEVCQSFALDNGAFSAWRRGAAVDWAGYVEWVRHWMRHPGFDFAVIPDVIDGGEEENDELIDRWDDMELAEIGVPVWHLHESVERLHGLSATRRCVALGSSGLYSDPGTKPWRTRMHEVLTSICDEQGRPPCKLHGLRMLDPTLFSQMPLSSADSTNVARNIGIDKAWDRAPYAPRSKAMRALIIADRVEHHASAATYQGTLATDHSQNLELIG